MTQSDAANSKSVSGWVTPASRKFRGKFPAKLFPTGGGDPAGPRVEFNRRNMVSLSPVDSDPAAAGRGPESSHDVCAAKPCGGVSDSDSDESVRRRFKLANSIGTCN